MGGRDDLVLELASLLTVVDETGGLSDDTVESFLKIYDSKVLTLTYAV